MGQLTDTNNLNFTLLIFYTNFYINSLVHLSFSFIYINLFLSLKKSIKFLALFPCFWCKYMAKKSMLQIKNTYRRIAFAYSLQNSTQIIWYLSFFWIYRKAYFVANYSCYVSQLIDT